MRLIKKWSELASLAACRSTVSKERLRSADADVFGEYREKGELRASLLKEQRGLCCCCLSPIRQEYEGMKIEHWRCQSEHPGQRLEYLNLLAACMGRKGRKPAGQHCDTRKSKQDLSKNPANPDHDVESSIRYVGGEIRSNDAQFDEDLRVILNLNLPFLVAQRENALSGFMDFLRMRPTLAAPDWEGFLADWNTDSDSGNLRPYCQVVVYWLRKKIARLSAHQAFESSPGISDAG